LAESSLDSVMDGYNKTQVLMKAYELEAEVKKQKENIEKAFKNFDETMLDKKGTVNYVKKIFKNMFTTIVDGRRNAEYFARKGLSLSAKNNLSKKKTYLKFLSNFTGKIC
jgi:hypothetical protein